MQKTQDKMEKRQSNLTSAWTGCSCTIPNMGQMTQLSGQDAQYKNDEAVHYIQLDMIQLDGPNKDLSFCLTCMCYVNDIGR